MHEAFDALPVLEKLPPSQIQIESLACHDEFLYLGCRQGQLVAYQVNKGTGGKKVITDIVKYLPKFGRNARPIVQIVVIPEFKLLISLCDNVVCVHDLLTFVAVTSVQKSKGATIFAVSMDEAKTLTGDVQYTLKLVVHCRRKLQFYYWKNYEFHELKSDLPTMDVPRAMVWLKDSVFLGYKRDYCLYTVSTATPKDLFPVGDKQAEPLITKMKNDQVGICHGGKTVFVTEEGRTQDHMLHWNEPPIALEEQTPYIVGVLADGVEVRSAEPRLMIQSFDLVKPRLICSGRGRKGRLYVASTDHVWWLCPTSPSRQIRQLVDMKEFELALRVSELYLEQEDSALTTGDSTDTQLRNRIKFLHALDLFCQYRFADSMRIFEDLKADPVTIIDLFPDLISDSSREFFRDPLLNDIPISSVPRLEGGELEKGLLALIDYLKKYRRQLIREISSATEDADPEVLRRKNWLHLIIDTTLLKCFMQTNEALVASLLRLKDNACHVEESEIVLRRSQKFSELIILYERKGLHKKALELLLKQSKKQVPSLRGPYMTVQYLQKLGIEHRDLIFHYAEWVLKEHPTDGLKIFTTEHTEIESIPKAQVLDFIERISKAQAIQYLEHILFEADNVDTTPLFHNRFIDLLRERVQDMMSDYLQSLPEGQGPAKAGREPGELGEYRSKLLNALNMSMHYEADRLLGHFPYGGFFEERAILLGRQGKFKQALSMYVHVLHDKPAAIRFCAEMYDKDHPVKRHVYLSLIQILLHPPDISTLGIFPANLERPFPDVVSSLSLLREHSDKIDIRRVIELLPPDTPMENILSYVEKVLQALDTSDRSAKLRVQLQSCENLQTLKERLDLERTRTSITDRVSCCVCTKRVSTSAFVRYPNGVVVHYGCYVEYGRNEVTATSTLT